MAPSSIPAEVLDRGLHEVRRPLQSLALALERPRPDAVAARACLAQIRAAVTALGAEVAGDPRPLHLQRLTVAQLLDPLRSRWRCSGRVRVEPALSAVVVEADPDRLGAALDNLVDNALEHGGPGEVRVRAVPTGTRISFVVLDGGGRRLAARPGEPVPAAGRRGLGLGLVAEIAAAHRGHCQGPIRTPGGGTATTLSLPFAASSGALW